ncbi:hypothetical protein Tsubulata_010917 [Turnera subulata]|uniref:Uncharacterized protein n=1 Tax=Turnera subulata TaxID=218843 RepID=A0A9Q0F480_9ROSI|nr:hypothetical protein Tsubulata_010917 [Turnera subulata]
MHHYWPNTNLFFLILNIQSRHRRYKIHLYKHNRRRVVINHTLPRRQLHQQQRRQSQHRYPPVHPLAIRTEPELHFQPIRHGLPQSHRRQVNPRPGTGPGLGPGFLGFSSAVPSCRFPSRIGDAPRRDGTRIDRSRRRWVWGRRMNPTRWYCRLRRRERRRRIGFSVWSRGACVEMGAARIVNTDSFDSYQHFTFFNSCCFCNTQEEPKQTIQKQPLSGTSMNKEDSFSSIRFPLPEQRSGSKTPQGPLKKQGRADWFDCR